METQLQSNVKASEVCAVRGIYCKTSIIFGLLTCRVRYLNKCIKQMCLVILHQACMKKQLMRFVEEQCAINTLNMGEKKKTYIQREILVI